MTTTPRQRILALRGLTVRFRKLNGDSVDVVRSVDLEVASGEVVGIVGESGSGKTMVGLSLLDLVPPRGERLLESLTLNGADLSRLDAASTQQMRGRDVAMVFQDPMSSFNPVRTVGESMLEVVRRHQKTSRPEALERCVEALADVGVPAPRERFGAYPHQLSGGLRQRVMIAMATLNNPSLLIADEPTTALDATIQAQILELLKERIDERGIILVTHDLGVAAAVCDRIVVMQSGRFVESGSTEDVLTHPRHEYTRKLIGAVPSFRRPYIVDRTARREAPDPPLLEGREISVTFRVGGRELRAVNRVNIAISRGETVGLVGESGSGKSTLIAALMGIHRASGGTVRFDGTDVMTLSHGELKRLRRRLQLVFQDPYASLNPRWTIRRIIGEPLRAQGIGSRTSNERRIREVLALVGLPEDALGRRPGQFSGGQRQRIAIARALVVEPEILIADEPVAALDVSMQAQIVTLLNQLQERLGVGYLIVAHDLALMHHIADRIVVMYLGEVVEEGDARTLTQAPLHPYTAALLSAAPDPERGRGANRIPLCGEQPSPLSPPPGCPFHTRCPVAKPRCREEKPALDARHGRRVACHYPGELSLTGT